MVPEWSLGSSLESNPGAEGQVLEPTEGLLTTPNRQAFVDPHPAPVSLDAGCRIALLEAKHRLLSCRSAGATAIARSGVSADA